MKTLIRLLTLAAVATFFALPAPAQDQPAAPADPCATAGEDQLYKDYYDQKNVKKDQAAAYETAKQYLAKYPACTDKYTANVKKFHDAYKAAVGDAALKNDFAAAVNAKDARKALPLGKQILASEPDNVKVALLMAFTGYNAVLPAGSAAGDAAVMTETVAAATKALEMLQAGKESKDADGKVNWAPFTGKDDALGWANYWAGALQFKTNPDATVRHMISVAQLASTAKEEPTVYTYLAVAYEQERAKLVEEYKKFTEENDQSRIVLANINQVVDRQIDAYARAVAFAKPGDARRTEWMNILKELYKSRNNNSEAGLDQKIAGIKTTPLLITTPVTTAPAVPANGNQPTATAERKP